MQRSVSLLLFVLCLVPLHPSVAHATYRIPRWVLANGGGKQTGPTHTLPATAGQTVIGLIQGPTHIHGIGFWYPGGTGGSAAPENGALPTGFALGPSFPSPAGPITQLRFAVPRRAAVTVRLYDVAGREVLTLTEGEVDPGYHKVVLDGNGLSGGVYFCRMVARGFVETRRLVLVK